MPRRKTSPLSSYPKSQIRDFVEDEKSLGRATKGEIAAAIGIRPSHFSNLLNGRNEWKLTQLERLAEFLGVPIARLFEERGKKTHPALAAASEPDALEDRLLRALRSESESLRDELRADLSALLREHAAGTGTMLAGREEPEGRPDAAIPLAGALPIEIRDLDAGYDGPPAASATESLWFRRDWLRRHGLDPARCLIVTVQSDSMERTLPPGCSVLINRDRRKREVGRIYALRLENEIVVGRADRDKQGRWLLESERPDGKPVPWPNDAEVVGEVQWMARSL